MSPDDSKPGPAAKSHPEDTCQQCGGRNVIWWVDRETWQSVMHGEGVVCPTCFMLKAIEVVGPVTWKVVRGNLADEMQRLGVVEKFTDSAEEVEVEKLEKLSQPEWQVTDDMYRATCDLMDHWTRTGALDRAHIARIAKLGYHAMVDAR